MALEKKKGGGGAMGQWQSISSSSAVNARPRCRTWQSPPQYEKMFVAARVKEQAAWESPMEILCDQNVHRHWCSGRWGSSAGGPE